MIHTTTPIDQNFDTMNQLADRTGGHAFFNTNNFEDAIAQAVDDARVTYPLGFYPDSEADDTDDGSSQGRGVGSGAGAG